MNPNYLTGHCRIAMYDLSIEDIEERKRRRKIYPTIQKATQYILNVTPKSLLTKIKNKERVVGHDGKYYAVRIIGENEYQQLNLKNL